MNWGKVRGNRKDESKADKAMIYNNIWELTGQKVEIINRLYKVKGRDTENREGNIGRAVRDLKETTGCVYVRTFSWSRKK